MSEVAVDFSLMAKSRPPVGGVGHEVWGLLTGWSWCGYCGYTGRVKGPIQAACPSRHGWHCWLERCVDLHELPYVRGGEPTQGEDRG